MTNIKPTIVKGWDIGKELYDEAHKSDELVKLVTEVFNGCNLSCPGCFSKRTDGQWSNKGKKRLPNEMSLDIQLALIEEAVSLGAKSMDIVGAGEPTLDLNFEAVIEYGLDKGLHSVIFTHGASPKFKYFAEKWKDAPVSFFLKLWSQNQKLQNEYVEGSVQNYAQQRDEAMQLLIDLGYNQANDCVVDGVEYVSSRIGADILVRKSNIQEIPDLFRYCRQNNIMPEIKTYIPEGPTRFIHSLAADLYGEDELTKLREDEVLPGEFSELRKQLASIDSEEFDIPKLFTLYPQATKCTQSKAAFYVSIQGDINTCVGSHEGYGKYIPDKNMIEGILKERKLQEQVGFGCPPRLKDAEQRNLTVGSELQIVYADGITDLTP